VSHPVPVGGNSWTDDETFSRGRAQEALLKDDLAIFLAADTNLRAGKAHGLDAPAALLPAAHEMIK
jgi:hypothetical protein